MTIEHKLSRTVLSGAVAGAFLITGAAAASAAPGNEWGGQDQQPDWEAIDDQEAGEQAFEDDRDAARDDAYTDPNRGGDRETAEDWSPEGGSGGNGAITQDEAPQPGDGGGTPTDGGGSATDGGTSTPGGTDAPVSSEDLADGVSIDADGNYVDADGNYVDADGNYLDVDEEGFVEYDENEGNPTEIEAGFIGGDNTNPAGLAGLIGGLGLIAAGTAFALRRNEALSNN